MTSELLKSKLFSPTQPHLSVIRNSISRTLELGTSKKLTLVCAGAGYGKTTQVSQWLEESLIPSAWLSLDEADKDPYRFFEYLIASLQCISDSLGEGLSALLKTSPPASLETITQILLNQLSEAKSKLILVLDDYHLAANKAVDDAVSLILQNLPQKIHLVIISRDEPKLPLARLRSDGELSELLSSDLKFNSSEISQFLAKNLTVELSTAELNELEQRTEGWIVGLKLAALVLSHKKDAQDYIKSFSGRHRYIYDYLWHEVLELQTMKVQSFLVQSAAFDRICGPLCDAVLNRTDSQEVLEYLEKSNLFIIPLDSERRWYRYHHLFRDALINVNQNSRAQISIRRRASIWYEGQGNQVEAFRLSVSCGDTDSALRLLHGNGRPLYFNGDAPLVVHWLSSMDADIVNADPRLLVIFAWSYLLTGRHSLIAEKLNLAEEAILSSGSKESSHIRDLKGQISVLRAWQAVSENKVNVILSNAAQGMEWLHRGNLHGRIAAHCALGVGELFVGRQDVARQVFATVLENGRASGNRMFTLVAAIALGGIYLSEFNLNLAEKTYKDALKLLTTPEDQVGYEIHLGLSKIYYEINDLDSAYLHASVSSRLSHRKDSETGFGGDIVLARLMLARREYKDCAFLLSQIAASDRTRRFSGRVRDVVDVEVSLSIDRKELEIAAALASKHQYRLGNIRVLVAQGRYELALAEINENYVDINTERNRYEFLKATLLKTVALRRLLRSDESLLQLKMLIGICQNQGAIRLFLDEYENIKGILDEYECFFSGNDYYKKLRSEFSATNTKKILSSQEEKTKQAHQKIALNENFSSREVEILRFIQEGLSNQQICEKLFLSLSTIKWHNQNIFSKLGAQRRTEAIARALELKIIS
jgi:LuxR family transcriptional regulator, maltose regulon positive regulatory protein